MKKHNCYDDIKGNIFLGWKCYKCERSLSWFKVFKLGISNYYE